MKIVLVVVGKTESQEVRSLIADYSKRLSHYTDFEMVETTDEKMMQTLDRYDRVFLLDERGKEHDSVGFSKLIEKQLNSGLKSIAFVVGGPFGFSEEVRSQSDGEVALSKMTFPHDLVRTIFLEQLYRAFTILKNEKYHHA